MIMYRVWIKNRGNPQFHDCGVYANRILAADESTRQLAGGCQTAYVETFEANLEGPFMAP